MVRLPPASPELKTEAAQGAVMSAREVLEGLAEEARDRSERGPRIRALELIGKRHELFTERR
jgi:hypothetical protein